MAHPLFDIVFSSSSSDDDSGEGHPRSPARRPRDVAVVKPDRGDADHQLAQIRTGNPDAFEALFRAEYVALHDFAAAWSGAPELAEEIVSDVFLWLYEHRTTVSPRTSLAAYLMGAVRHRALNVRRASARSAARYQSLAAETHESVVPHREDTPEERWIARESDVRRARMLAHAMAPLSQMARSVFLLRLQAEMSYAEIAEVLGVSANAAKTHFSRTLAAVRRSVAEQDEEEM
jgi:RNA polymerase sigma-70 factor (ECF subfamily)